MTDQATWANNEALSSDTHQLSRVTTKAVPLIHAAALPPPSPLFRNNPHSSITYTHNQYSLSAVIDPVVVYTQLPSPDCGLMPGIKDPEKDTWSSAPASPQPSPGCVESNGEQTSKALNFYKVNCSVKTGQWPYNELCSWVITDLWMAIDALRAVWVFLLLDGDGRRSISWRRKDIFKMFFYTVPKFQPSWSWY